MTADRSEGLPITIAITIFAILSVAAAVTSTGFLEADACTHLIHARFALAEPHYLVNIWGRPICTGLYALPATYIGRIGVQLTSLLVAIGCALVAWRIAKVQQYRWPAMALVFTLAQPLVFLHSFSELTELPFALILGLSFWAYTRRQWPLMAIIISWSPLSRPEGFGFLFLAAVALIVHRRWWWIPLLVIPLVLWSYVGWVVFGSNGTWWTWLPDNWPYSAQSPYKPGSIAHFFIFLPLYASPLLLPTMGIGIWRSLQCRPDPEGAASMLAWNQKLIAIIPLLIFIGHSLLYALGKMASNGELRYMLVVAPFWGLLTAGGWEWLWTRLEWRRPFLWAGAAALFPILCNFYYGVVPIRADADFREANQIAQWYAQSGVSRSFPRLAAAHVAIYYYMDISITDGSRVVDWRKDRLDRTAPGVLVVWDPIYSLFNSDQNRIVSLKELTDAGWLDVTDRVPKFGPNWRLLVSPTDAQGSDALEALSFPLRP